MYGQLVLDFMEFECCIWYTCFNFQTGISKCSRQLVSKWETGDSIPDIDRILVLFWFFEAV